MMKDNSEHFNDKGEVMGMLRIWWFWEWCDDGDRHIVVMKISKLSQPWYSDYDNNGDDVEQFF